MSERPGDRPEHVGPPSDDELWQAIVANYGERAIPADLDEPDDADDADDADDTEDAEDRDRADGSDWQDWDEPDLTDLVDPADHYVPPPPPPLPRPEAPRLLAWAGVFLVPLLLLVNSVAQLTVPSWAVLLLMCWFVGGFAFLVATMSQGPPPGGFDGDDGARL